MPEKRPVLSLRIVAVLLALAPWTSLSATDVPFSSVLYTVDTASKDGARRISWHENTVGDGSAWTEVLISTTPTTPNGSRSLYASDVDGDGDKDVLVASNTDNQHLGAASDRHLRRWTVDARGGSGRRRGRLERGPRRRRDRLVGEHRG